MIIWFAQSKLIKDQTLDKPFLMHGKEKWLW